MKRRIISIVLAAVLIAQSQTAVRAEEILFSGEDGVEALSVSETAPETDADVGYLIEEAENETEGTQTGPEAENESESSLEMENEPENGAQVSPEAESEENGTESVFEEEYESESGADVDGLIEDPEAGGDEELFLVSETLELSDPGVVPNGGAGGASYGIKGAARAAYSGCFGNQLDGMARLFYEERVAFYAVSQNTGTMKLSYSKTESPVTFPAEVVSGEDGAKKIDQTTEAYQEFRQAVLFAMQSSIDAFIYDHPEVFWLRGGTYSFSVGAYGNAANGYVGYLSGISYTPRTAFAGAEDLMGAFADGVDRAAAQVTAEADAKGNRDGNTDVLELARAAHDYLCERLYYDSASLQNYQETGEYRIFCAAGAFVDSVGNGVVCEGYAKAYKILCEKLGIPCVLIGGTVTQGGAAQGHMWNGVYLAGGWYLTDVTWDDKSGGYIYDYFMVGDITSNRSSSGNFSGSAQGSTTVFVYPPLAQQALDPCTAGSHDWDAGVLVEATCAEPACTRYTCRLCGCTYCKETGGSPDPEAHDYRETERKAASCTESGYILYTCTRNCTKNHTRKTILPSLGHNYKNGVCTRCGKGDTLAHAAVSSIASRTYTGSRITPVPVVKFGTNTLKQNTDYRLTYQNNLRAGTATVVIQGIGKYSGTTKVTFQIKKKSIGNVSCGKVADRTYNGKSHWPGVAVKDGKRVLVRGTDYSLSHSKNKEVGTATVTVRGIGNYTGTRKLTFRILPKTVSGQKVSSKTRGKITVSWKKVAKSSGYQIQYGVKSSFSGAKTVTVKSSSSSKVISGLKRGKTYYVRIRSYKNVNGKAYYSKWCAKKKVTVKK